MSEPDLFIDNVERDERRASDQPSNGDTTNLHEVML